MEKILVIAEKPSVAREYAEVLSATEKKIGYIEGNKYIVTWCVGHLFKLKEPDQYDVKYKSWKLEDLPIIPEPEFELQVIDSAKEQFSTIKKLIHRPDVKEIINGGDAGREGELIQRYVLEQSKNKKPVKRLWLSSLTKEDIKNGFANLRAAAEYDNLYHAGVTRSKLDWLIGMNYTRAYTLKANNKRKISVGRVQTAVLNEIVKRDISIENFTSNKYYNIIADFGDFKAKYLLNSEDKIDSIEDANNIVSNCEGKDFIVEQIKEEENRINSPGLYDLTSLQQKMNSRYGFSAAETLEIAQVLYEKYKIISYPRTSSKYLSESFISELKEYINNLNCVFIEYVNNIDLDNIKTSKRFIDDTKITDHHALIPCLNKKLSDIYRTLNENEKKLYDEVAKSFLLVFMEPYIYNKSDILINIFETQHNFKAVIKKRISLGWKEFISDNYEEEEEEDIVTEISIMPGDFLSLKLLSAEEKETSPPSYYTESTLLAMMEKYSVGTPATRAEIIEKIIKSDFIARDKKKLLSTTTGRDVVDAILIESLKDISYTSELEKQLELIEQGKLAADELITTEVEILKSNIEEIKKQDISIAEKAEKIKVQRKKTSGNNKAVLRDKKGNIEETSINKLGDIDIRTCEYRQLEIKELDDKGGELIKDRKLKREREEVQKHLDNLLNLKEELFKQLEALENQKIGIFTKHRKHLLEIRDLRKGELEREIVNINKSIDELKYINEFAYTK